jgi:hypothetical protein
MPKATIDKYCYTLCVENNIRRAVYITGVLPPPTQAQSGKHGKHASFQSCTFSFDRLHRPFSNFRS